MIACGFFCSCLILLLSLFFFVLVCCCCIILLNFFPFWLGQLSPMVLFEHTASIIMVIIILSMYIGNIALFTVKG